jgi:predicted nicotinamide N-methyase
LNYQTQTDLIDLGALAVKITHITNQDDLLNALIAKGEDHEDYQDDRLPYWADLWHAAIALGQYLVSEQVVQPNELVTEIGCGLGLPGIVAGMLGGQVTLTDYLPEALEFAQVNWSQNNTKPANYAVLDWRKPEPALAADLLLASDVAYETRAFTALTKALPLLVRPHGRIILSEPSRGVAKPFLAQLQDLPGFTAKQSQIRILWNDFWIAVNILDLKKLS